MNEYPQYTQAVWVKGACFIQMPT